MNNDIFFSIHCLALIALAFNVGYKQGGWDTISKKFTTTGKIALLLICIDLVAFIYFLTSPSANPSFILVYGSIFLGFAITLLAYVIPFMASLHYKYSKKLNSVGVITIILGITGFVPSLFLILSADAIKLSEDYVTILGHFITVASATVALVTPAIQDKETGAKGEDYMLERRDLKKIAIKLIMIGFVVSVLESIINNRDAEALIDKIETAKINILKLDSSIDKTIVKLGAVNKQLGENVTSRLGSLQNKTDSLLSNDSIQKIALKALKDSTKTLLSNDLTQKIALKALKDSTKTLLSNDLTQKIALKALKDSTKTLLSNDLTQKIALKALKDSIKTLLSNDLTQKIALKALKDSIKTILSNDLTQQVALKALKDSIKTILSNDLTQKIALKALKNSTKTLLSNDLTQQVALKALKDSTKTLLSNDLTQKIALKALKNSTKTLLSNDLTQQAELLKFLSKDSAQQVIFLDSLLKSKEKN